MNEIKDKFEEQLEQSTKDLQNCQEKHEKSSCLSCKQVIGCDTREKYVKAVYDSMSKGTGGGFEF